MTIEVNIIRISGKVVWWCFQSVQRRKQFKSLPSRRMKQIKKQCVLIPPTNISSYFKCIQLIYEMFYERIVTFVGRFSRFNPKYARVRARTCVCLSVRYFGRVVSVFSKEFGEITKHATERKSYFKLESDNNLLKPKNKVIHLLT